MTLFEVNKEDLSWGTKDLSWGTKEKTPEVKPEQSTPEIKN
jgi:hypothetical protein